MIIILFFILINKAWVHFTSGLVAEFAGALLWTPQDVIKQKLQVLPPNSRISTLKLTNNIIKENGIGGLWKGFGAGLLAYGPFVGIYFVSYEQFKRLSQKIAKVQTEREIPSGYYLLSGALAGGISAAVTCPFDVIKTRIQINNSEEYSTIRKAIFSMKKEGYGVFWKGLSARITWIAPSCAITLGAYEYCKVFITKEVFFCL